MQNAFVNSASPGNGPKTEPQLSSPYTDLAPEDFQRWCIIRKSSEDPAHVFVKIEIAHATPALLEILQGQQDWLKFFRSCEKDKLAWWKEVETQQMPLADFLKKLDGWHLVPTRFHKSNPIDEGMVFLFMERTNKALHFTYQAREMSKQIYQRLLGNENSESAFGD